MKCGVMTFYRAINYRDVFQMYALGKYVLDSFNVECEIIDSINRNCEDVVHLSL